MFLKKVIIRNFRAISDVEIEFTPGANLLIGDNGVGKSSVLEAIAVVLFGILRGVKGVPVKNILQDEAKGLKNAIEDSIDKPEEFDPSKDKEHPQN